MIEDEKWFDILALYALIAVLITAIILFVVFPEPRTKATTPPYCQYGDITGDGQVTLADLYFPPQTWYQLERADVDNDGDYDIIDNRMINDYITGKITQFPVGDKASDSYQYDLPPYIKTMLGDVSGNVGDLFTWQITANDSNGETLKVYVEIYKDSQLVHKFQEHVVEPSETITETYTFDNAGDYYVYAYATYKYRTFPWISCDVPLHVVVSSPSPPPPPPEENIPPVANFTFYISGMSINCFDKSYDLDGSIVNWTWDFGDGSVAYGKTVSHTYSQAGTYRVTLTVTDDDGLTSSIMKSVVIEKEQNYLFYLGIISIIVALAIGYKWFKKVRK